LINKEKFLKAVSDRVDDINKCNSKSYKDASIEKIIVYLLDIYKSGSFDGIISIRIKKEQIFQPRLDSVVVPVESDYRYLDG
jgi:hypothetical protein